MNLNETIINVIFDAGRGETSVASREVTSGKPFGTLPVPTRAGYTFKGWYLGETPITAETLVESEEDIRVVARWSKKKKTDAAPKSTFKKQKIAAIALAITTVVLIGVLLLVNYGISIYPLKDTWTTEDGVEHYETYYVRKKNGEYGLYNKDGKLMEINEISTKNQQQDSDTLYVVYIAETSGNQYLIDSETGSATRYAVVDYGGDEVLGFRDRVLMFPQITQTNIYSIEVNNEFGRYKFYRDKNGVFCLEDFEKSPAGYSAEGIADLCSACGYTISLRKLDLKGDVSRLPDGSVDYAAYGLAEIYDENGELTYKPATFTIVKAKYEGKNCYASDTSYTVKVGYKTLSGNGYYMQMEGREAIYVGDTLVQNTVLGPVENMIAPIIMHSMTMSNYLMVKNFLLGTIDGKVSSESLDLSKMMPLVAFSYQDLDERLSTVYTGTPYVYPSDFDIMEGYALNDSKVSDMLMQLYQLQADSCVRLGVTAETLQEFGLDKDVYYLMFDSPATDANGNLYYNENILLIGQKTERDTYYIASFVSGMILEVPASSMPFMEWKESDWYLQYFFQHRIDYITSLGIQIGDKNYNFTLDNTFSYAFYENAKGVMTRISLEKGKVRKGADGNWIYTDENGRDYTVKLFDFTKGDIYIRLDSKEKGADPLYYSYYKYLITKNRNGDIKMKITELENGVEYVTEIDLGTTSNEKYSYRLVYIAEDGEEFDVAGAYNNANGERFSAYYQMPYWEEGSDNKWTRKATPSLATNLMLRDSKGKLYQIPTGSNNMQVYSEQYQGGTAHPNLLDYNTVYTYRTDTGEIKTGNYSGIKNFRQLFALLPNYSLESQIDVEAFIARHNMTPDEYIKTVAPYATFTYSVRDMADNMNVLSYIDRTATTLKDPVSEEKVWHDYNETNTVVRLYQYSATRSIITIETNGGDTVAVFYVLTDYCNILLDAAEKVLSGYPINPEGEIVEIK